MTTEGILLIQTRTLGAKLVNGVYIPDRVCIDSPPSYISTSVLSSMVTQDVGYSYRVCPISSPLTLGQLWLVELPPVMAVRTNPAPTYFDVLLE